MHESTLSPTPTENASDWSKIKRGVQLVGQGFGDWSEGVRAKTQSRVPEWITRNGSRFASLCQAAGSAFFIAHARREDARALKAGTPPEAQLIGLQVANWVEIAGVALGTLIPEKADRPEDTARQEAMSGPRFALEKIKQAFNPLRNIRETIGLGTLISGVVQTFTGFQNGNDARYAYLKSYGPFLAAGGAALLFSRKDADAWKRFGTIMTVNAINGIQGTIGNVKRKAWLMVSGLASFQLSNITMFFFAGTKQEAAAAAIETQPPENGVFPTNNQSIATRLIAETAVGSPTQAERMGWLKDAGVTPEDFAKACAGFAQGVQYIATRFGTEPKSLVIDDSLPVDGSSGNYYDVEDQQVHLSRHSLKQIIQNGRASSAHIIPLHLHFADAMKMYGVEEAYHHYQNRHHPLKDQFFHAELDLPNGHYNKNNIVEQDAEKIVREALIDMNMLDNPLLLSKANAEDMAWYEAAVKQNALRTATAGSASDQSLATRLIAETAVGSPTQAERMGWLKDAGVTPEAFADVCAGFARGVDYIAKRFGTEAKIILVDDAATQDGLNWVHYSIRKQEIHFSRKTIESLIRKPNFQQNKILPLLLGPVNNAMMYGVEEAYHHYQNEHHPIKEIFTHAEDCLPNGKYDPHNTLEQNAKQVVRQALIDLKMLDHPIKTEHATAEDMEWYESVMRLKTDHPTSLKSDKPVARSQDYRQQLSLEKTQSSPMLQI